MGFTGFGLDTAAVRRAGAVIVAGTTLPAGFAPNVILPIANVAEEEGTFTNLRGRAQRFLQAKAAPGVARPTWYVLADLLTEVGGNGRFYLPAEVFAALASTHASFAGLDYEALGLRGLPLVEQAAATTAATTAARAEVTA